MRRRRCGVQCWLGNPSASQRNLPLLANGEKCPKIKMTFRPPCIDLTFLAFVIGVSECGHLTVARRLQEIKGQKPPDVPSMCLVWIGLWVFWPVIGRLGGNIIGIFGFGLFALMSVRFHSACCGARGNATAYAGKYSAAEQIPKERLGGRWEKMHILLVQS